MAKCEKPINPILVRKRLFRRYTNAVLNLYGVIKLADFIEVFNHYETNQTNKEEACEMLTALSKEERIGLSFARNILSNGYFQLEEEDELREAKMVLSMQKGKPRYLPTKKEFVRYCDELYIEPLAPLLEMEKFIVENQLVKIKEPDDILFDVLEFHDRIIIGERPSSFFEYIKTRGYKFKKDIQLDLFLALVMNANNNTRMYENNGHTPYELREIYPVKEKNDPGKNKA